MPAGGINGEDVLVRYLSDSLRLVEGVLRKNARSEVPAGSGKMAGASQHPRQQPTTARGPSSDVGGGRNRSAGRAPHSLEAEERLRRSMQAWPGGKPGMVRWSSASRGRGAEGAITGNDRQEAAGRKSEQLPQNHQASKSTPQTQPQQESRRQYPPGTTTSQPTARSNGPARPAAGSLNPAAGRPPPTPVHKAAQPQPRAGNGAGKHQQVPAGHISAKSMQRPPPAPSEAGTNKDWWRPGSGGSSVGSYPMTAVTDRNGSMASTEFKAWMDRISSLESAVNDERGKRRQFEEELQKMQSDAMFQVSRGYLSTGKPGGAAVPPNAGQAGGRAR